MIGKKRWSISLICILLLAGCGQTDRPIAAVSSVQADQQLETGSSEAVYLSMATSGDWSLSLKGEILKDEIENLEKESGGTIHIKLYDRERLGDDSHITLGVQSGTIDMIQSCPSGQINTVPEAALMDIPGEISSLDEANALYSGDYKKIMGSYYHAQGLQLLNVFAFSYRELSSRDPVREAVDLQGMRIRTMESKYQEAYWNSLGAIAVSQPFDELYYCLNIGLVDAQENLIDTVLAENLTEVQNYITFTDHMPMTSAIAMNLEKYESLSELQKQYLTKFTENLKRALLKSIPENEQQLSESLSSDYQVQLIKPSKELKRRLTEGSQSVIQLLRKDLGDDKVDQYLEAVHAVKGK